MQNYLHTLRLLLVVLLAMLVLAACSSSGRSYTSSNMVETLETEILPNTSKMFVYRLRWPEDQIPSHIRIAKTSRSVRPYDQSGVEINRNSYNRLQENTAYVVAHLGYCREGFLELDSSLSRYHLWLKGECKEAASAADQTKFGARKTIPIKSKM